MRGKISALKIAIRAYPGINASASLPLASLNPPLCPRFPAPPLRGNKLTDALQEEQKQGFTDIQTNIGAKI